MNVHAQPMAQPMRKKIAETRLLDDRAGFGVNLLGLRAGPDRRDAPFLSCQHGSINLFKFRSDLTGDENASQVTFVGPTGRSPVEEHEFVIADAGRGRWPS